MFLKGTAHSGWKAWKKLCSDSVHEASSYRPGCGETTLLSQATWGVKRHTFEKIIPAGLVDCLHSLKEGLGILWDPHLSI